MRLGVCLLLLAGCGGAPFTAAGPDLLERDGAPDVAVQEGGPTQDGGGGEGDALADGEGGQVEAGAEADAPADAGRDAACQTDFPDGGYQCGGGWVNVPNAYVCVTKHDGSETTVGPAAAFCQSCATCATCRGPAVCATLGQSFLSCSDTGGELRVSCG